MKMFYNVLNSVATHHMWLLNTGNVATAAKELTFTFGFILIHLFLYFKLIFFYWSRVALQCCASFRCTAVSQLHIHIYPLFFRFFSHIGHYRVLSRVPCAI